MEDVVHPGTTPQASECGDLWSPSAQVPDDLPVISLHQPWASLCFVPDCKGDETRGRSAPARIIGKRFGIHAALKVVKPLKLPRDLDLLCREVFGRYYQHRLPYGALLGSAICARSVMIGDALRDSGGGRNLICGDWEPGRHAWRLAEQLLLAEPVPMKGRQSWWRVPLQILSGGAQDASITDASQAHRDEPESPITKAQPTPSDRGE